MSKDMEVRRANLGEPDGDLVWKLTDAIRKAMMPFVDMDDLPHFMSLSMTAASTYAGIQIGTLIAMGVANEEDQENIVEAMTKNIENGVKIGIKMTFDAAATMHGPEGHV